MQFRAENIPLGMISSIIRYIVFGIQPGSFLSAVFRNELVGAYSCADSDNEVLMRGYADFLYSHAPTECWGSKAKIDAWSTERMENGPLHPDCVRWPTPDWLRIAQKMVAEESEGFDRCRAARQAEKPEGA